MFDLLPAGETPTAVVLTAEQTAVDRSQATFTTLWFTDQTSTQRTFGIAVSERGRFRRNFCTHPPLKLNFRKRELRAAGLTDHDKYKLVSVCYDGPAAKALILREFLTYRTHRLLTPYSYRVQLLQITYRCPGEPTADRTVTAFILESRTNWPNGSESPSRSESTAARQTGTIPTRMPSTDDFST